MALKLFPSIIIVLIVAACKKVDLSIINNLNGNKILVIGHGGEGFQTGRHPVPTNSELSFKKAIELHNADGCEMDVQMSKDSVLMLFHDDDLEKTTDCHGCLTDKTAAELVNCRFKQDFAVNTFENEKIITLEHLFEKYSDSYYVPKFFLDVKTTPYCDKNIENYSNAVAIKLTSLISKYNSIEDRIYIQCGNTDLLNKIKAINSNLKLIIDMGSGEFQEGLNIALQNNFFGIELINNKVTKDQVKEAHSHNLWVIVYGVKSRGSQIKAVEKSPEVIETDNIPLLQEILKD